MQRSNGKRAPAPPVPLDRVAQPHVMKPGIWSVSDLVAEIRKLDSTRPPRLSAARSASAPPKSPACVPTIFRPVAPGRRRPTTPASQSLAPIPPPASTWRACRPMISHAADEDRRSRSQPLSPTRKTDVSKPSQSSDSTRTHLRYLPSSTNSHRLMLFRKGKRGSRGCIFHATAAIDPSSSPETKRDNLPCVQVTPKETFFLFGPADALCPERKVPSTDDRRAI